MAFPCTQCGACCMNVGHVAPLLDLGWVGNDGVCQRYDREARKCSIYDDRPTVCRIDEGRPQEIPADAWTAMNLSACDVLHLAIYGAEREQLGTCVHKE